MTSSSVEQNDASAACPTSSSTLPADADSKDNCLLLPPLLLNSNTKFVNRRKTGLSKKLALRLSPSVSTSDVSAQKITATTLQIFATRPDKSSDGSISSEPILHRNLSTDNEEAENIINEQREPRLRRRSQTANLDLNKLNAAYAETNETISLRTPSSLPPSLSAWGESSSLHSMRNTILPKISNQEARKKLNRNYLIVKNGLRPSSSTSHCVNAEELDCCFPDRKVTIFVGTWNMAGQDVSTRVLTDWLIPEDMHMTADIYAVGIQEAATNQNNFKAWESKLQKCLWPCKQVLFHSVYMGVQHLAIFVRRELIWFLSRVGHCSKSTRIVSNVKTKGAIAVCLKLFGTTMLFISSHLSYGPDADNRVRDYHRIVESLHWKSFGLRGWDVLNNTDIVFWAGDLNFRLEGKRTVVESLLNAAAQVDYAILLERDQLKREIAQGRLFHKFSEHQIQFPPTYKYDIGTTVFDTSTKNRVPAYTDRILFRTMHADESDPLEVISYNCASSVTNSDHKPVYGVFRAAIVAGHDNMPTPKFDASVFQASLAKERESRRYNSHVRSAICRIM